MKTLEEYPGWLDHSQEVQDIAREMLKQQGKLNEDGTIVGGTDKGIFDKGFPCAVLCQATYAAECIASGGNPVLIALAFAKAVKCLKGC